MSGIASTPAPPYYAVIFTSLRTPEDAGYAQAAKQMLALAAQQPGYLGVESARGADGLGITVSYWSSEEAIRAWKQNAEHAVIQRFGRDKWYAAFTTRVCRVERQNAFTV